MFYSSKNLFVSLNDSLLYASEAQLSVQASLEPNYTQEDRYTDKFSAREGLRGSLRLSYYLTGRDYLKTFISDDKNVISGHIGGMYFNSGYLTNYGFNVTPVGPVIINADIAFFENVKGVFASTTSTKEELEVFNFSDASIVNLDNHNVENFANFLTANFTFTNEITPIYFERTGLGLTEITPHRIAYGKKETTLDITVDSVSGVLPFSGDKCGATITLSHPSLPISEVFTCSGRMQQRGINSTARQNIIGTVSITQQNLPDPPSVTSFFPDTAVTLSEITVRGANFSDTIEVKFYDRPARFTVFEDSLLKAYVPLDAVSGPIYVKSHRGVGVSSSDFTVTYPTTLISELSPYLGVSGDYIYINCENLYRVTDVEFNEIPAEFKWISHNLVRATVPTGNVYAPIHVISTDRNYDTPSFQSFIPIPTITDFTPKTGIRGQKISITGYYFHAPGVTKVFFNDIEASFEYNNDKNVTGIVPFGNTKGPIRVEGDFRIGRDSEAFFEPVVALTGISPATQSGLGEIFLYGNNFFPELLHLEENTFNDYRVSFNGGVTGLELINEWTLSGKVPPSAATGPVHVAEFDGVSLYDTSVTLFKRNDKPYITSKSISGMFSGSGLYMTVYGQNLFDISGIYLTGITYPEGATAGNIGLGVDIERPFIYVDRLGKKITVSAFQTEDICVTGVYDLLVSGYEGIGVATGDYAEFRIIKYADPNKQINWAHSTI